MAKHRRAATREIKRIEREGGPIDSTPHPDLPLMSLRERIHLRLTRGMPIHFCRWCKRVYLFDSPGADTTHCSPTCRRAEHDNHQRILRATVTHEGLYHPHVDVRLRLNLPNLRACAQCDLPLLHDVPKKRFCSDACRARHWRENKRAHTRKCKECGRAFEFNPIAKVKSSFCGDPCRRRAYNRTHRPCLVCKKVFELPPDRIHRRFCSIPCACEYRARTPERCCIGCGTSYRPYKSAKKRQRYCSRNCWKREDYRQRRDSGRWYKKKPHPAR